MNNLSDRLSRLRKSGHLPRGIAPGAQKVSRRPPGADWIPFGEMLWERRLETDRILPDEFVDPFVLPEGSSGSDFIFYDLETTGLSGGAGNLAFLIGLGWQSGETFVVHQLFLADYPGEPGLLDRFSELSKPDRPHLSYNGRSFDSQVLKTRFLLNRKPPVEALQVDLLYPTRRLWSRRLPDCRLGTIESEVLGFHRTGDLPGSEAPDAWFEWLKGSDARIGAVFDHNAEDIQSLARLLVRIEEWGAVDPKRSGEKSPRPSGVPPSQLGMARQWSRRRPERGWNWIEAGWIAREADCGGELARHFRRGGHFEEARSIWECLNADGQNFAACVELAKYWEHHRREPRRALEILARLDEVPLGDRRRREVEHRRQRLERKKLKN